ncbi:unnamed protein product [Candidula unifasciata]|uniref:Guided entry of tail-anchored proteins factor 1 n=1 Tax=Candidula unifasciata TaxID=100452 RepID=A0A8S3ZXN3_9EUPU|nr:unnamed protein product [Candidula unifasciata]
MYLMIFVFLLEVLFAFLPTYIGIMTTLIAKLFFTVTDEEMNSREEIKALKEEQAQLSITDEFVRYAKLQRQVDKLMLQIKEKGSERKQHVYYLRLAVTAGIYVLHAALVIAMMFMYSDTPLMSLDPSWVSPLTSLVAFPTGISGAVGLGCWLLVSYSVIYRVKSVAGL